MKSNKLFFCVYNEEEIDNDLEIEAVLNDFKELCSFLNKSRSALNNLGVKKEKGLKTYINIKNKKYLIIVDKD